jgi:hypothetical protein
MGNKVRTLILRIKRELYLFDKVTFLHIKQDLNSNADHWDNIVVELNL